MKKSKRSNVDPFIVMDVMEAARKAEQAGKSLKQYKTDMLNKMEKDKYESIQGVSDDIQMLDYVLTKLRDAEAHFNIVPFGLNDLQSLRSAFGMLANNASNALVRGKFDKLDKKN